MLLILLKINNFSDGFDSSPNVILSVKWTDSDANRPSDAIGPQLFMHKGGAMKSGTAGDIVFTGSNFGCGSSRQQAVDCFKALGVSVLVAESFGVIYKRNAINAAMPIMTAHIADKISTGDEVQINIQTGEIKNLSTGATVSGTPFSDVQIEILQRGGLLHK